jgi:hypothetical protein
MDAFFSWRRPKTPTKTNPPVITWMKSCSPTCS